MSGKTNSEKHRVTFGVRVPNSGPLATAESMVQVAQEAESLGYDSIWVHDHLTWSDEIHRTHISSGADHGDAGNLSPDFYEALTSLAYLAGQVRLLRLGIACVVVPCRNPLLAAKQLATLDVLCQGRLDIGVGIGSPSTIKSREYEVLGVNRTQRGKIADDHLRAMKTIWTTHPSSYEGPFVKFNDAAICPKPVQKPHPPLWVGGWTEAAMKRTAALGDGWLPPGSCRKTSVSASMKSRKWPSARDVIRKRFISASKSMAASTKTRPRPGATVSVHWPSAKALLKDF
jgi:probable F420-dependent oxidoreductase